MRYTDVAREVQRSILGCGFPLGRGRWPADARSHKPKKRNATMSKVREGKQNYVFWLGLTLCTIYQSYRYPLQVNTAGLSPAYSDTPTILQAGKFVLAFPLIVISAVQWLRNSARTARWPIVLSTLFLSTYSLLKVLGGYDSQYLDVFFWMLFALVLVLAVESVSVSAIDRYLCFLLAYAFGSTLIQLFLFFAFGRLPAMAYEGTYLIRFGGFLDDPNGFAAILFLLMGWSYKRFKGSSRFLILFGLIVSLFLTQSWTALGFLLVLLLVCSVIAVSKHPLWGILAICTISFVIILAVHWVQQLPTGLMDILDAKGGSIGEHQFPWEQWSSIWTNWALLGDWKYNAYESWWAAAMVNFGLLWSAVYVSLITALLVYLRRFFLKAPIEARPVHTGLLVFGCFFAVGSLNLPFPIKFPINALFFLFSFLVAFGKIETDEGSTAASRKLSLAEVRSQSTCS